MTNADVRQDSAAGQDLGAMPVWNLDDLYPSPTSAEFQRDLGKAAADAKRIAGTYKGKLAGLDKDGAALAEAVAAYEALSDTLGRLGSYAGLLYAADTTDPAKAKFYGDVQEKLTAIIEISSGPRQLSGRLQARALRYRENCGSWRLLNRPDALRLIRGR